MLRWITTHAELTAIILNLFIAGACTISGQYWKAFYWVCAAGIALAVMQMKG